MNMPNRAWYHQSILDGTVYACAESASRTWGRPNATAPPAMAAALIS